MSACPGAQVREQMAPLYVSSQDFDSSIRYSLAGQDTRLSPERPGLEVPVAELPTHVLLGRVWGRGCRLTDLHETCLWLVPARPSCRMAQLENTTAHTDRQLGDGSLVQRAGDRS